MLVRLWVKETFCHWLRSLLPHMPIPADPRSVQKDGLNPLWPFNWPLWGEGVFGATMGGWGWGCREVRTVAVKPNCTKGFHHGDVDRTPNKFMSVYTNELHSQCSHSSCYTEKYGWKSASQQHPWVREQHKQSQWEELVGSCYYVIWKKLKLQKLKA